MLVLSVMPHNRVYFLLPRLLQNRQLRFDLLHQFSIPLLLNYLLRTLQVMLGRIGLLNTDVHQPQHLQRLAHVQRTRSIHLLLRLLYHICFYQYLLKNSYCLLESLVFDQRTRYTSLEFKDILIVFVV